MFLYNARKNDTMQSTDSKEKQVSKHIQYGWYFFFFNYIRQVLNYC